MADPSVILELLRLERERQNQPSQAQIAMQGMQSAIEGMARGIQLYDAIKTLQMKYPSSAKPSPAVQPQGTAPTAGMDISSLVSPTAASSVGTTAGAPASFPQPVASSANQVTPPVPAASPSTFPGTAVLDMLSKVGAVYPEAGRRLGAQFGFQPGQSLGEINANAMKGLYGLDSKNTPVLLGTIPRRAQVVPPATGNIYEVPPGGGTPKKIGTKGKTDVVHFAGEPPGKTPKQRLVDILQKADDDARSAASMQKSVAGVIPPTAYANEFTKRAESYIKADSDVAKLFKNSADLAATLKQHVEGDPEVWKQMNALEYGEKKASVTQVKLRYGGQLPPSEIEAFRIRNRNMPVSVQNEILGIQ